MSRLTPATDVALARNVAIRHGITRCRQRRGARTIALSIGVVVSVMLTLTVISTKASAESLAEREACTPDVFRLCSDYIPDRVSIVQCLTRNNDRLSSGCRAVFAGKLR